MSLGLKIKEGSFSFNTIWRLKMLEVHLQFGGSKCWKSQILSMNTIKKYLQDYSIKLLRPNRLPNIQGALNCRQTVAPFVDDFEKEKGQACRSGVLFVIKIFIRLKTEVRLELSFCYIKGFSNICGQIASKLLTLIISASAASCQLLQALQGLTCTVCTLFINNSTK